MEVQRIRSVLFLWQKLCLWFTVVLFMGCYFLFTTGRYASKPYIARYNPPSWVYMLGYITMFILFCMVLYLFFAQWYKRDKIHLTDNNITIRGKDFSIREMQDLAINEHPLKYKPKNNRTIFNGGGNNWIKFKYNGKKYKVEYFLPDSESEDCIKDIFDQWQSIVPIQYGVSADQDLLELYDSLSFRSKYDRFKFS